MYLRQVSFGSEMAYSNFQQAKQVLNSGTRLPPMKNPYDVLRTKEQELVRVRKEIEALRIADALVTAAVQKGEPSRVLIGAIESPLRLHQRRPPVDPT